MYNKCDDYCGLVGGFMEILGLIDELEELVNEASAIPFSNRIVLDKDDISDILRRINVAIPEEVRRAKWIKEEKDQILIEAKKEAEEILKSAQAEEARLLDHAKFEENRVIEDARSIADNLVSNNEITVLAENHCRNLVDDAESKAKDIKEGAYHYADDMLEELQYKLQDFLETLNHNRSELVKFVKVED